MKERPILFSAPMVRAINADRKTQTRRTVKPQPEWTEPATAWTFHEDGHSGPGWYAHNDDYPEEGSLFYRCPYGQPGDRLWVRETWQHANSPHGPYEPGCTCFYRADYWDDPHGMDGEKSPEGKYRAWIPSIHMPRAASRINLEVVHVRVEKLQDISEADAIAEGVQSVGGGRYWLGADGLTPRGSAVTAYRDLWIHINGAESWDENPWVWVVEFKRIEPPKNGD